MSILSKVSPVDRLRLLPRWIPRKGNLQQVLTALVDYRVYQEIRSALGTVPLWPSWVHVYPLVVTSYSTTVTAAASGKRVRVYQSKDPIGSLYRPTPFYITTDQATIFFQLGLEEQVVPSQEEPVDGQYVYLPQPRAQPLERAFRKRGRVWELIASERDGSFRLPEDGEWLFCYLPLGELPTYLGPDGLPLQILPLQYWQRGLAQMAGLVGVDRCSVGVLLEKLARLGPVSPLFGIAGELELSERQERLDSYRPAVWTGVDATYHDEYPGMNRIGRAGLVRLPATPVPHTDLWVARGIRVDSPAFLVLPGTVMSRGRGNPVATWTGAVSRSSGLQLSGMTTTGLGWQMRVLSLRGVYAWLTPTVGLTARSSGFGTLPAPVVGMRGYLEPPVSVGWDAGWSGSWESVWTGELALPSGLAGDWDAGWSGSWGAGWSGELVSESAGGLESSVWLAPLGGSGNLWGWGTNRYGETGTAGAGGTATPVWLPKRLTAIQSLVSVSVGAYHALVLTREALYACGSNRYGQWGTGQAEGEHIYHELTEITSSLPSGVTPSAIRQVVAGENVSFLVLRDGRVYGAGGNDAGVLGLTGSGTESNPAVQWTQIPVLAGVREMVVSARNGFARTESGALWVSGSNGSGQYGNGSTEPAAGWNLVDLSVMGGVYRVAPYDDGDAVTVLAVDDRSFQVWGWGANPYGILGQSGSQRVTTPVRVPVGVTGRVSEIGCGGAPIWAACLVDGRLFGWGSVSSGVPCRSHEQRVRGGWVAPQQPVRMDEVPAAPAEPEAVRLGSRYPYEALWFVVGNDLYVWGDLSKSQPFYATETPTMLFRTLAGVRSASVPNHPGDGGLMGLAIDSEGFLRANGQERYGGTGSGQYPNDYMAWERVQTGPRLDGRFVRVYTNGWSSCFVDESGATFMVGANHSGQLGLGNLFGTEVSALVELYALPDRIREAVLVRNTDPHAPVGWTLFVTESNELYGCGDNAHGQLGLGDTAQRNLPMRVATGVKSASGVEWDGVRFSAFLTTDGRLFVMGDLRTGADGNGIGVPRQTTTPVLVQGIPQGDILDFVVTTGGGMLALDRNGYVWAWGVDHLGELGAGAGPAAAIPTPVRVYLVEEPVLRMGAYVHGVYVLTTRGLLLAGIIPYGNAAWTSVSPCLDWSGYFSRWTFSDLVGLRVGAGMLFVSDREGRTYHLGRLPFHPLSQMGIRGCLQPLQLERYRTGLAT